MKFQRSKWWLSRGLLMAVIIACVAFVGLRELVKDDYAAAGKRLLLLVELRKDALQGFFDTSEAELVFWSESDYFAETFAQGSGMWQAFASKGGDPAAVLRKQYIDNNPYPEHERYKMIKAPDEDEETSLHARMHPFISHFIQTRGYDDFLQITPDGYVYYSVQKRSDYATNLRHWPYAATELAKVYRASMARPYSGTVHTSDLAPYPAKQNHQAIFMSRTMLNPEGDILGSIALELPSQRIDDIMQFEAGLGQAGEMFLVGPDGQPRRSQQGDQENPSIDAKIGTSIVAAAQQTEQGLLLAHSDDDAYIWAWDSLRVGDSRWTIIGRADKQAIATAKFKRHQGIALLLIAFYGLAMSTLWLFSVRGPEETLVDFDTLSETNAVIDDAGS